MVNYDWFGKMGFLEFLRDVKHLTISYMMSKESVETWLGIKEFLTPSLPSCYKAAIFTTLPA